jgi:hypothetical protein
MEKKIIVLGIVLVIGLVFLSGCVEKERELPPATVQPEEPPATEPPETEPPETEPPETEPPEEPECDEDNESLICTGEETPSETGEVGGLTQEDLDKLKEGIEGLEIEDLGGLSEE